ncbi:MAG TPA: SPOR domain-containing protein [Burkholderiaceae bacterium]|nr:SPOR domain-containing protein [Burkholderiaceae bacterium]
MLRWVVLVLVVANLGFWAWSQGWLAGPFGLGPAVQTESHRPAQQVRPDVVRVLPPPAASAALTQAAAAAAAAERTAVEQAAAAQPAAQVCLEAGPYTSAALDAVEQALAAVLPARGWVRASREVGASYVVFIGPMASAESVKKKGDELRGLKLAFDELRLPGAREAGLALGRYETRAAANAALDAFANRGVRTARVVVAREAGTEWRLRIDNAAPALAEQLRALKLPEGAFATCSG